MTLARNKKNMLTESDKERRNMKHENKPVTWGKVVAGSDIRFISLTVSDTNNNNYVKFREIAF